MRGYRIVNRTFCPDRILMSWVGYSGTNRIQCQHNGLNVLSILMVKNRESGNIDDRQAGLDRKTCLAVLTRGECRRKVIHK